MESHSVVPLFPRSFPFCQFLQLKQSGKKLIFWQEDRGFLQIEGTHHGVSKKHMQAYVNEFVFRHNRRRTPMAAFQTVLGLATRTEGPTYADLYAAGPRGRWKHPNS